MRVLFYILLLINVLLAISSGISKVLLVPQEVEFFGEFGFNNAIIMAFGALQCIAGITMAIPKTRLLGLAMGAITFLISAVILFFANKITMVLITLAFVLILGCLASYHKKVIQGAQRHQTD
jgi:hypothetical protein